MTPVASGKLSNAGYYTIPFDKQIALDAGERYAVVLFISLMWETIHIIEQMGEWKPKYVIWENVKNVENCNICIKAFSNDR